MTIIGAVLIEVILLVLRVNLSLVGKVKYLQAIFEYARYGPKIGATSVNRFTSALVCSVVRVSGQSRQSMIAPESKVFDVYFASVERSVY